MRITFRVYRSVAAHSNILYLYGHIKLKTSTSLEEWMFQGTLYTSSHIPQRRKIYPIFRLKYNPISSALIHTLNTYIDIHIYIYYNTSSHNIYYCGTLSETSIQKAQRWPRPPSQVYAFARLKLFTMPGPSRTR